jgi:hypothetical protein
MITQLSNNRYQDQNGKSCDAGVAIMGRTIDGNFTYKFLAIDANGNLTVTNGVAVYDGFTSPDAPQVLTIPLGLKAAGILLGYVTIGTFTATEQIIQTVPNLVLDAAVGGSVSFVLIQDGSALDAYTLTRVVGVDSWNPPAATFVGGNIAQWHNIAMSAIGGGALKFSTPNAQQDKFIQVVNDSYKLAIIVDTAITINGTLGWISMQYGLQVATTG